MPKKRQSNINIFLGIAVIIIGSIGSLFWGLGLALQNTQLLWIGRLMVASLPFIVVLIERFIK